MIIRTKLNYQKKLTATTPGRKYNVDSLIKYRSKRSNYKVRLENAIANLHFKLKKLIEISTESILVTFISSFFMDL